MKTIVCIFVALLLLPLAASPADGLKVFISVDMEGITGVVTSEECSRSGMDYGYFRRLMTEEANAAIKGALSAGATEIWVRDSHGSARNILPDQLHQKALLLRDWSGGPMSMMEGIDETFDAVIFIGYHAKAGTADAIIDHTSSGTVTDMAVNGISLPEAGYYGLLAGHFDVPVVFVAGDQAVCEQAKTLFGEVETVAVKRGFGNASLSMHPKQAWNRIRQGVHKALANLSAYKAYKLTAPYTLVLKLKSEQMVYNGSFYPGAERTGDWELTFKSDSILEIIKAFSYMRR